MSDQSAFAATYSDWKPIKTRRVIQLVFEVPWERSDEAYQSLGGMPDPAKERWFGIARLDLKRVKEGLHEVTDKQVSAHSNHEGPAVNSATPQPQARNLYATRAGILSNEPEFAKYVKWAGHDGEPAQVIRDFCGVQSRADILPDTEAALRLDLLESDYLAWRAAP